jgi:hypothetical protein
MNIVRLLFLVMETQRVLREVGTIKEWSKNQVTLPVVWVTCSLIQKFSASFVQFVLCLSWIVGTTSTVRSVDTLQHRA